MFEMSCWLDKEASDYIGSDYDLSNDRVANIVKMRVDHEKIRLENDVFIWIDDQPRPSYPKDTDQQMKADQLMTNLVNSKPPPRPEI